MDFPLPESVVERQRDAILADFAKRAGNIDAAALNEQRDRLMGEMTAEAERQVRFFYLAEAIAKEEKIECKPEECGRKVIDFVLDNAK